MVDVIIYESVHVKLTDEEIDIMKKAQRIFADLNLKMVQGDCCNTEMGKYLYGATYDTANFMRGVGITPLEPDFRSKRMTQTEREVLEKHGHDLDRMIPVSEIYTALKETYLEVSDPQKEVAGVTASKFRGMVLVKLGIQENKLQAS